MADGDERPNIVVILVDDMGFSDIGCYGGEIQTPHLDGMARRGIAFSQFYNTPRCCPSRASLLTGLHPHQAGIGHMTGDYGKPGYRGFLNDRCATIAEALRPAGYRTLMSGKWHVGEHRPHWPCDRGFDRYVGLISGASNYWMLDGNRQMAVDDQPFAPEPDGFYMTDFITDQAVNLIGKHGGGEEPFFLYVAYTAPHWPLHAWPEDIEKYRGSYMGGWDTLREQRLARQVAMGLIEPTWPLTRRDKQAPPWDEMPDKERRDLDMAVYAAQVDRMDQGVGTVLAKLGEMGILENTLVMFLSDNGGCAEEVGRDKPYIAPGPRESFRSYGLPWANASNTPFRLYKHWVHEGGIATPFIAQWPARVPDGQLTHEPGHIIDIMATCLDAAGAPYPREHAGQPITPLEGKSLLPLFETGQREGHQTLFWEHEGNKAVRQGRWKLVCKFPGDWELYDMAANRTETDDLKDRHPDKAAQLAARYEEWARPRNVLPWPVKR
ncbi:MAG: arylsulfatase [Candidatus Brocadiia bacterium]